MTEDLPTICAGCGRIEVDGKWIEGESFSGYHETRRKLEDVNRYCPQCTEYFKKEYKRLKDAYKLLRNWAFFEKESSGGKEKKKKWKH